MKKNDLKDILGLGAAGISGKIAELEKKVATIKLDLKRGKQKNVREAKTLRRSIAVLKTKLTEGVK